MLAGLCADGYTTVDDIHYIQRGYENFDEKLISLGASIKIVEDEKDEQRFKLQVV